MSFATQLRKIRIEKEIKQTDLADALGVHKSTVAKYESGERFPDELTILNISKILKTSLDELFDIL